MEKTYFYHGRSSGVGLAHLKAFLEAEGPMLCELMIDSDLQIVLRISSVLDEQGRLVSRPLEDLWPFLSREEVEGTARWRRV